MRSPDCCKHAVEMEKALAVLPVELEFRTVSYMFGLVFADGVAFLESLLPRILQGLSCQKTKTPEQLLESSCDRLERVAAGSVRGRTKSLPNSKGVYRCVLACLNPPVWWASLRDWVSSEAIGQSV